MEREQLHYITEDKILAEILGRQNFSSKESAILELVKNAYDAGSSQVTLQFHSSTNGMVLTISDDGEGMDTESIKNSWMHVGKSTRGYINNKLDRVYAGSKGIGRFALSRLGESVEMQSKKDTSTGIIWQTDWGKAFLRTDFSRNSKGTTFTIKGLRDRWTSRSIETLKKYLSIIYNDDRMSIEIIFGNSVFKNVSRKWEKPKLGLNHVSELHISYDSDTHSLDGRIVSDEFNDNVLDITKQESITFGKIHKNMFDALRKNIKNLIEDDVEHEAEISKKISWEDEAKELLTSLGNFSASFYFGIGTTSKKNAEYFEYKNNNLLEPFEAGIVLYRNAFSIDSFEGTTDWLGLNKRVLQSPAAATHPTGNWRVRPRNLSGYVDIDKKNNKHIEDLSNRQGIVQNIYFSLLKLIIIEGIKGFENFRQSIIRDIDDYKKKETESKIIKSSEQQEVIDIFSNIRNNHDEIKKLTENQIEIVIKDYDRKEKENKTIEQEKRALEEKFRYESQLLNVLATSQLKISSVGHEVKNDRNIIFQTPSDLEDAVKSELDWENFVDSEIPFYRNIPELFESLKENTNKILDLADSILEETEKSKFKKEKYCVNDIIDKIINKWKNQYNWIEICLEVDESLEVFISEDYLMVIFDNLILNSIQQNDKMQNLIISIKISLSDKVDSDRLDFVYEDNGKGLDEKYVSNPREILEVHESTRDEGHGLGMWIINNTLHKLDGKIDDVKGDNGFYISGYFMLKDMI